MIALYIYIFGNNNIEVISPTLQNYQYNKKL